MRDLPLHLTNATNAEKFIDFLFDENATASHKKARIREIMRHFPSRTFILVGDSGEADPEVYRDIKDDPKFGHRVQAIFIRTVTESKPGRLEGMQTIEATTITPGVSELDR
jgi:phosphatidate phosphatase APP1